MNNVPDDVRIETYVRAKTMDAIDRTNAKVDAALRAGGAAIGAKVNIDTLPGQLPLICNQEMNELFVTMPRKPSRRWKSPMPVISALPRTWGMCPT